MSEGGTASGAPAISVVIVSFNSRSELEHTLPAVVEELSDGDELIVVDNASQDGSAEAARELAPQARVMALSENVGFAEGSNRGAAVAGSDLVVFLNPDARPLPGFGEAIRRPAGREDWAAWMGLVAYEHARFVNSQGNVVHFTGIAWAGGHGNPIPAGLEPREVTAASGACLAVRREVWEELGGFPEEFFLYHEDIDFSLRLWLYGFRAGIEPSAVVDHDYEFGSRPHKWRWLERNRWAVLIRIYPAALLVFVAPALLITEFVLLAVALRGGWIRQKLGAMIDVASWLPRLLEERREVQARRAITASDFAGHLTPDLETPFIGTRARSGATRSFLRAYWRGVIALLALLHRARPGRDHP